MPAFVEGRILYDQGKYEEALPAFEEAVAAARKPGATPIPELHFYAGDTLLRLERHAEAEAEFVNELRRFPQNVRARAALATLYHATGQARRGGHRHHRHAPRGPYAGDLHHRRAPVDLVRPDRARRRRSAPKRGARSPTAARAPPRTTNDEQSWRQAR